MITIEFFHDVICSFCFPMSYRMRQVQKEMSDINIVHCSFALAWEPEHLAQMFGSREQAKKEILSHWTQANQNDDLHRFNISGMEQADFPFPTSKNGLIAAKAARIIAGEEGYWQIFDALQEALFVHNQNIEDLNVISSIVQKSTLDFEQWQQAFHDPKTLALVESDFQLADKYQLSGVPALIVNGKYLINGAQPLEQIIQALKTIQEKEAPIIEVIDTNQPSDASCTMENGKWICKD
ncbi:DsbA family oxidoreductase [Enterococcus termitis]|uniref:DsbA family oxidoreductase n=1 Tax=Enterococcus termitis TaxID=332950 RepID=UPI000B2B1CCB|nr:DsbA family protein [Enterococcus termitis]